MGYLVDVHAHLTHERFAEDLPEVIAAAEAVGVGRIVVNGLDPASNQEVAKMAQAYAIVVPAMGIYPVQAVNAMLPKDFPVPTPRFDVTAEIVAIREHAKAGSIAAVGECGLDGYWLGEDTFAAQERVFEELVDIAHEFALPVIVHSRKLERRCLEILAASGHDKVVMHCFSAKAKLALSYAEQYPWCFSIPANCERNEGFQKLLRSLPPELILTETDCPYLAPEPGARNTPANVVRTVALFAQLRQLSLDEAREVVWCNYQRLFLEKN